MPFLGSALFAVVVLSVHSVLPLSEGGGGPYERQMDRGGEWNLQAAEAEAGGNAEPFGGGEVFASGPNQCPGSDGTRKPYNREVASKKAKASKVCLLRA